MEELRVGNGVVKPAGVDLGQVKVHLVAVLILPVTGQGFELHAAQVPGNLGADAPGLRFIVGRDIPVRVPDVRQHGAAGKSDIRVVRQRRTHVGSGAAAGLIVRVIAEHADTYCVGRPEQQLGAEGLYVRGVFVFTGKTVIRIAIIVMEQAGNAQRGALTEGNIQRAFHPDGGVIAAADVQVAAQFIFRLPAQEVYNATGGVSAEQGALGPLDDFHPFRIVKIADNGRQPRQVHAVYMHRGGRFQARCQGIGADPAHVGKTMTGQGFEMQPGDLELQVQGCVNPDCFQLLVGKCVDGYGNVLNGFCTSLGRNDDLFQKYRSLGNYSSGCRHTRNNAQYNK